ncbi:beta-glucoside-specific PTS transporter subunit IIABC [Microbacterium sp. 18062]|uniref:beta-glucoside-specific PTS transporter subunit IIABC n=1 Tax=Microbacterium sp. 18062 TaxID=2681410 RepID=UPI001359AB85|nr:beta-glucoside-specific PTS transporter subunit IIABC [Microbacterium sp. 18062]
MAKVDYARLATEVLENVGGEANVSSVSHCATRLRFVLKDPERADKDAVTKIPGVISALESGGQFQVVVGNNVPLAYAELERSTDLGGGERRAGTVIAAQKQGNILSRALNGAIAVVSAIFAPIIGTLCAAGILKGLLMIATTLGWLSTTSTTYAILWTAADAFFFFLPVILAVPAARKFGANIYTAMALASGLLYTQVANVSLVLEGETVSQPLRAFQQAGGAVDFLGIPVVLQGYSATVIPIILAVYLQSWIEKLLSPRIHDSVRNFIVPLVSLVVTLPATLLVLGPVGNWVGQGIADLFLTIQSFSPILTGILFAALWQVLVIFGVHWAMVPIFINNLATTGYDTFKPLVWPAVFGQAGAALGVFLRLRDPRTRGISGSAVIAGLFGITEPAIYGVTLPRKRVFAIGLLSAAVGGAIVGGAGARVYGYGLSGILTLPLGYGDPLGLGDTFLWLVLGTAVSFVMAAILTYFFGITRTELVADREAAAERRAEHAGTSAVELVSPIAGVAIPLDEVNDELFSSGAMGPGFAIRPADGRVVSPFDGTVIAVMPHAVGLRSEDGVELLIHVGIDTVALAGEPFVSHVEPEQHISRGELLIEADIEEITARGYDPTTVIVVSNPDDVDVSAPLVDGAVAAGAPVLTLRHRLAVRDA